MYKGFAIPLQPHAPLATAPDLIHTHPGWWQEWDHGAMDNFANGTGSMLAYSYVNRSELAPYWILAKNFTPSVTGCFNRTPAPASPRTST